MLLGLSPQGAAVLWLQPRVMAPAFMVVDMFISQRRNLMRRSAHAISACRNGYA